MNKIYIALTLAFITFFSTCSLISDIDEADEFKVEGDTELAIPLFYTESNISDLIDGDNEDAEIKVSYRGADSLVVFTFDAQQTEVNVGDQFQLNFVNLKDLPMIDTVTNPITFPLPVASEIEIDSFVFSEGVFTIKYEIKGVAGDTIDFNFIYEEFKGFEYKFQKIIPTGQTQISGDTIIDLNQEMLIPDADGMLTMQHIITKNSSPFTNKKDVSVLVSLADIDYDIAYGYFGDDEVEFLKDTIDFSVFNNYVSGDFSFTDPRVLIYVSNEIGFPIDFNIVDFSSESNTGNKVDITGDIINNAPEIGFPPLSNIDSVVIDTITVDASNSNIVEVLANEPTRFFLDVIGKSNPEEDRTKRGFVKNSSKIQANVEVEIPLKGTLNEFRLLDTLNVNLNLEESNIDKYETVELKFVIDNNIPLEAAMQLYMYDSTNAVILDSLLDSQQIIVEPAGYNINGSTVVNNSTVFVELNEKQINSLVKSNQLILDAILSSSNQSEVTITAQQKISARAGVKISFKNL